jgi:hypothetical protein
MMNTRTDPASLNILGWFIAGLLGSTAGIVLALGTARTAHADYTPGFLYAGIGPGGANFRDFSSDLTQDGVDAWNYFLGVPAFSATTCVSNKSCVMFVEEGTVFTIGANDLHCPY